MLLHEVERFSDTDVGVSKQQSGDRIEFQDLGSITLGMIRRYETVEALLEAEGWSNVVPEADDAAHSASLLRTSAGWNKTVEADRGVLALRVRKTKRKS